MKAQISSRDRFVFMDLIKGLAIFEFICWHVFEKFYANSPSSAPLYRILFSVTGFFVLSSGFMVGCHYYSKLKSSKGSELGAIFFRICIRSLKLILIVVSANIVMLVLTSGYSSEGLLSLLRKVSSMIYIDRWDISLQVLLAIATTLIIGNLIVIAVNRYKYSGVVIFSVLLAIIFGDLTADSRIPYLWRYVLHGIFGVFVGIVFYEKILNAERSKCCIQFIAFNFLLIFISLSSIVALKSSTYDFFLYKLAPDILASSAFLLGFGCLFYLLYDVNSKTLSIVGRFVKNLGKNSLFIYIVQISLIDMIVILFPGYQLFDQLSCFALTFLIIVACIKFNIILDFIRKHHIVNRIYCLVFQ
jgi:hypothetical protein